MTRALITDAFQRELAEHTGCFLVIGTTETAIIFQRVGNKMVKFVGALSYTSKSVDYDELMDLVRAA